MRYNSWNLWIEYDLSNNLVTNFTLNSSEAESIGSFNGALINDIMLVLDKDGIIWEYNVETHNILLKNGPLLVGLI